jgi:hypothetical protein
MASRTFLGWREIGGDAQGRETDFARLGRRDAQDEPKERQGEKRGEHRRRREDQ